MDAHDPTGRQSDAQQPTQRIEAPGASWHDASSPDPSQEHRSELTPRRGRDAAFVALGAVLGALLSVIGIAVGTSSDGRTGDERVEELEAALAERDAQLEERDTELEGLRARLEDEQDTDAREAELEERRDSLDERASALDERASELDRREVELDQRQRELQQSSDTSESSGTSDSGSDNGEGDMDEEADGDGAQDGSLTEQAQNVVDRIVEEIRQLLGPND